MRWFIVILALVTTHSFAQPNTFRCSLKSHDDSIEFTISDPRLPKPVIIGANGSNPLKMVASLVTPDGETMLLLIEELGAGGAHMNNLIADGNGFRAVHLRWSNPDPKSGFYGRCRPI